MLVIKLITVSFQGILFYIIIYFQSKIYILNL